MTEQRTELIIDHEGIEMLVAYNIQHIPVVEEFHGTQNLSYDYIELENVEVIIGGRGIDILPMMTEKQQEIIRDHLSIY